MKKLILYGITLFLVSACAKKVAICGLAFTTENLQKTPSTISISKNILIADTIVANVYGKIYGDYLITSEKFDPEDVLPFANITLMNTKTQKVFGMTSDLDGAYSFTIPAATYQLEVTFVGFNTISIDHIKLGTGEILNLSAHLGIGIDKEYFEIRDHRRTKELIRNTN